MLYNNLWRTAEQQSFVKYFHEINPVVSFISFVFVSRFFHMRAWNFLFTEIIKYGWLPDKCRKQQLGFIFFFFPTLSVRDINHCILWRQCEISLWLRKRYINCVCTQKTSSRSLMYHIRLSNNLGLSFLEEFGISGAGMEKGWDQGQRAYFMGEGKSLIFKAPSSKHSHLQGTLLSTCPAEWYGGERRKNTASRVGRSR